MKNIRIAVSAVVGNVYIGRLNKQGNGFTAKEERTGDFLKAVVEYGEHQGGEFDVTIDGVATHRVTVTKLDNE